MKKRHIILVVYFLFFSAPFLGAWPGGLRPDLFRYPPLVIEPPIHAPFSWWVFSLFAVVTLLFACLIIRPTRFGFRKADLSKRTRAVTRLPNWGWVGLALAALSWVCAWGRFDLLGATRDYLFFPLWLGYILTMDGLTYRRAGHSLLSRSPRTFLMLFPASALSWWTFEYLNRFVQNWWYSGIDGFGSIQYILYATLCFSTVLPAVFGTYEWLKSFPYFDRSFRRGVRWPALSTAHLIALVTAGTAGLALLAARPDPFFFLTWLAPLAILGGLLGLAGLTTPFHSLRKGDYTALIGLAMAALICGLFWEMWNYFSSPQWHYSVPYVNRLPIFEMPAVGYGGYLPFGPICLCFWLMWRTILPTSYPFADEEHSIPKNET